MASRRSHAAYHSKTPISAVSSHSRNTYRRRVPRGHVSIRNPLQAPKERSCVISITSPSLGSAKRDRLSSSTSYEVLSVPLRGTIFRWRSRTYPQLRSFGACSGFHDIGPAPRNPQLILNLLVVRGCVATARRHSLLSLFCWL